MSAAHDLLHDYQHVINDLRLVTGSRGIFDVIVDDKVLFSKHAVGRHANPGEVLRNVMRVVHEVNAWTAMAAIFGFARLWLTRDSPARRYLTEAIFPLYIMHQTIIVVVGHHLAKLDLPLEIEGPILIAITFAGCFATYETVCRIGFLRPWFGLKSLRRHPKSDAVGDAVPDVV